jgi:hypothetical protein
MPTSTFRKLPNLQAHFRAKERNKESYRNNFVQLWR